MNKEEFTNSKMKLSKEDIIYDYYNTEEKLTEKLGIEHENYELQQENKQLKAQIEEYQKALDKTMSEIIDIQNNYNKLKEYFNERIEVCDNRLSSPFCDFEKTTKERLIFSQCLEKLKE